MSAPTEHRELNAWLRQLRWSLAALPEEDRREIVAELESHLHDRIDAGMSVPHALASLGSPSDCARPYVEQYGAARALGSGKVLELLPLVGRRSARDLAAIATLVLCGLLWVLPLALAATSVMKLVSPKVAGLWRANGNYMLGVIDDPARGTELLGPWLFPLAIVAVLLAVMASRWLLLRVARRLFPQQ